MAKSSAADSLERLAELLEASLEYVGNTQDALRQAAAEEAGLAERRLKQAQSQTARLLRELKKIERQIGGILAKEDKQRRCAVLK
jgi:hypothetical protein